MANYVNIAASLDGFIASEDGGLDWLTEIPNPVGSDYGFSVFIDSIDAIIMGRNTFDTVLSFGEWPYSKPVFVLSRSKKSVPDYLQGKAEFISGELKSIISILKRKGYHNLYIDGGKVIQSFLQEDLIDVITLTRATVLLGSGVPLFGNMKIPLKFIHKTTEVLNEYLVKSTFKRQRRG